MIGCDGSLVIAVRHEAIGLATKERAKLKAFEEILTQRSGSTRESNSARESGSTRDSAAPTRKSTWRSADLAQTFEDTRRYSPAAPRQVILEDTPEPAIKPEPELAQTPQQLEPRQVVLEFNVGDQSNWELACETARKSGAVSAKVVLSFRYIMYTYALWC